jgi:deoxyribonuclease-4
VVPGSATVRGGRVSLRAPYTIMLIGAHVDRGAVLEQARATGAGVVQIFLSGPRTWAAPKLKGDETAIRESGLAVYVHAPYLLNPASLNPEVREKSRRCLVEQTRAAALVGAAGVVVHGGHPTGNGSVEDGIRGWVEVLEGLELPVPVLIENTAGGAAAVARRFDAFARLYERLVGSGVEIGICLDTCHAHAGGEELGRACEKLLAFAGRIDLVHANDSKDPFDSGRDRHANFGSGMCGVGAVADVMVRANCPAVVETPGGVEMMRGDIEKLRGCFT